MLPDGASTLTPACCLLLIACLATAAPCSVSNIAQLEPPFPYYYYLLLTMTRKTTRNETKAIKRMYRKRKAPLRWCLAPWFSSAIIHVNVPLTASQAQALSQGKSSVKTNAWTAASAPESMPHCVSARWVEFSSLLTHIWGKHCLRKRMPMFCVV